MIQVLPFQASNAHTNAAATYAQVFEGCPEDSNQDTITGVWPVTGSLTFLRIELSAAPGTGKSWTFTVLVEGVDTAAVVTISDTATIGTWAGTVAITAGQRVVMRYDPSGTPAGQVTHVTVEYDSSTDYASGYLTTVSVSSVNQIFGAFGAGRTNAVVGVGSDVANISPLAGNIVEIFGRIEASGSATTITCTLYKNGIAQDGTGGTPNATLVIVAATGAEASASVAVTVPIAANDTLHVIAVRTSGVTRTLAWACRVEAAIAGQSIMAAHFAAPSSSATRWAPLRSSETTSVWQSVITNTGHRAWSGVTPFSLSDLYVQLKTAPGAGNTRQFLVDVDGVDTALTVTLADSDVSEALVGTTIDVAADVALTIEHRPASGPVVDLSVLSAVQTTTVEGSPPPGSPSPAEEAETFALERAFRGEDVALCWVEYEGQDANGADATFVWSGIALADREAYYHGFKDAKLILVSDLVYALSDKFGRLQATKATFELSDLPDADGQRLVGGFLGRTTGYVARNTPITIRLISDQGRRAERTPVTIFRGQVDELAGLDEYRIRFDCVSWLARRLDQPVVERRIRDDFPGAPVGVRDRPVPLLLGRHSDEGGGEAPVIVLDEAGTGDFFDARRGMWVPGFGTLGGDPPTSVTPTENAGAGEIPAGEYYIYAWSIDAAGNASDPEPFDTHDLTITVSDDAEIAVAFTKGASAVTTRVALATRGPGTAYDLVYVHHLLETAGTSVTFTKYVELEGRLLTAADMTPGGFSPYGLGFRMLAVTAIVNGIESRPAILQLYQEAYNRPFRFAWTPVVDATAYAVYMDSAGQGWDRRLDVAIQLNGNGDQYVETLWDADTWEHVDGLLDQAIGVVPLTFVGYFTDLTGHSVGGFLVAAHALASTVTINLYQDETVVPDAEYDEARIFAPGKANFTTYIGTDTFRTINGHRYTLVYLRPGHRLDGALDGSRPLYGNFYGAETVGDGTGTEITSVYQQLRLLLNNLLASTPPVLGEAWVTSSPTFADGVVMIDEDSLTDAEASAGALIPAGADGGRYLAQDLTWAQLFPDWCPSAKAHVGVTLQGQVRVVVIDPDADAVTTITEAYETIRNSFQYQDRAQGFANAVPYQAVPRYSVEGAVAAYDATPDPLEHTASQTRHRDERTVAPTFALTWRRDAGAARQVAQAFLAESAYLPRDVRQSSVLHWVHRSLGDILGVVHREGAAAEGWTAARPRKHALLGMRIAIPSNRVEYTCVDLRTHVGDLSAFEVELLMGVITLGGSLETPCIDDADVGSPALVAPPDWRIAVVDWDQIPETWELVFDVNAKILPASPVGSPAPTVQPALYLSTEDQDDTPVATGTATASAVRERQQVVVTRPVGSGVKSYRMLPILANGALTAEAYLYGVLRLREIGSEA